jgi:hypothetical protein
MWIGQSLDNNIDWIPIFACFVHRLKEDLEALAEKLKAKDEAIDA